MAGKRMNGEGSIYPRNSDGRWFASIVVSDELGRPKRRTVSAKTKDAARSLIATTVTTVPSERFPAPIEATAYFVVCEALTNVAKHAAANSATIAIVRSASVLSVRVDDDGIGGARPDRGSGLRGLADRVASIGGSLRIESPSGAGTHVEAEIPCP
jgi:signal transduction histidine kinase